MSDLPRWSEDGATRDELRLLDASRGERPDPAARARTLAALGLGGGGPTGGPPPPAGNGPGTPGKIGRTGKLVGLGGLAALVVTGGLWYARPHRPPGPATRPPRAEVAPVAPTEAPAIAVAAAPQASPAGGRERSIHRSLRWPAHEAGRSPPAPSPSLAEEVAALERARGALTGGDPAAAQRALDAYRVRFPEGSLSSEETVLRVQTLLAQGNQGEAIFVAETFSAMHPGDPYAQRLKKLLTAAVTNSRDE